MEKRKVWKPSRQGPQEVWPKMGGGQDKLGAGLDNFHPTARTTPDKSGTGPRTVWLTKTNKSFVSFKTFPETVLAQSGTASKSPE